MMKFRKNWQNYTKELAERLAAKKMQRTLLSLFIWMTGIVFIFCFRNFLSEMLPRILSIPMAKWSALEIIIFSGLLLILLTALLSLIRLVRPKRSIKRKFIFIDYGGFFWKASLLTASVLDMPYCKEHRSQLFLAANSKFFCEGCLGSKASSPTAWLTKSIIKDLHTAAESRAEALIFKHERMEVLSLTNAPEHIY